METPIQFRIDQKDGVGIFHIDDRRLDSKISTLYKQEFVRLKEQGLTQLVVDLSDVEFIDSSGLGALLMGRRLMEEAGGDLCVSGTQEKVLHMFRIVKLDRVFAFFDTADAAIEGFKAGA
ncbi:MAG: STAS domain-containing protein [Bacteroidetes bacterium]|nr:STAS domain-containing protein [Bacteroidota bacterium]